MATGWALQSDVHPLFEARNMIAMSTGGSHVDFVESWNSGNSNLLFAIAYIDLRRLLKLALRVFESGAFRD